jgi:hypothetical protein
VCAINQKYLSVPSDDPTELQQPYASCLCKEDLVVRVVDMLCVYTETCCFSAIIGFSI